MGTKVNSTNIYHYEVHTILLFHNFLNKPKSLTFQHAFSYSEFQLFGQVLLAGRANMITKNT
jgi:hypothetical protein